MACPRCNSPDIFSKKFGFGDVTMHEYSCNDCGLFEEKKSTDPDFATWRKRWEAEVAGSRDVQAIAAAAIARARSANAKRGDDGEDDDGEPPTATGAAGAMVAVVNAPDDDAPRLAYADALARVRPDRAEFIRLQIERAAEETRTRALQSRPGSREAELRAAHGKEWAQQIAAYGRPITSDGKFRGYEFERGFVAMIRTEPEIVYDRSSRLFDLAPIQHVDITSDGEVRPLLGSPALSRLRSLGLDGLGLTDDDIHVLVGEGRLAKCEWLDLRDNQITKKGVAELLSSPVIRAIPMVMLDGNPSNPAMQFSRDHDGSIMDQWLPAEGKEAEATYGRIPWLHLPAGPQPDRYHARHVRYED